MNFFITEGNDGIHARLRVRKLGAFLNRLVRRAALGVIKYNYVRGFKNLMFQWFLFFEQFDPNPVTEEGQRRRAIKEARARGEHVEDEADLKTILPSFLPW